jgi:hypothetical protein
MKDTTIDEDYLTIGQHNGRVTAWAIQRVDAGGGMFYVSYAPYDNSNNSVLLEWAGWGFTADHKLNFTPVPHFS